MRLTRRYFVKSTIACATLISILSLLPGCQQPIKASPTFRKPNILLVITDDQGFGDLSLHGNPHLKTPTIDKFAAENTEFTNFYVSPVCAPTRASLMTGRYHMRTGVVDTYLGRAMMYPEEFTVAELLKEQGYTTGLFGKWHLGDNYPLRPQDQGFDEVIMHLGGGIGQPSDPPSSSYFDPILQHNGKEKKYKGYCMDVYTDLTIDFIKKNKNKPFFAYLSTNTPHSPLQVPDEYLAQYRDMGLKDKTARVYGMVKNIDDNFARLLDAIKREGISENTIIIFMSDNGPCPSSIESDRHMAGLRGRKATVYENGIKVPFFISWPGRFAKNRKIDSPSAHIDILPTLLDICQQELPAGVDGTSLVPLLKGDKTQLPDRTLYFQTHRGDEPELFRCFSIRDNKYKLVQNAGWDPVPKSKYKFELFDIANDPYEKSDIADTNPEIVKDMKNRYKQWFEDVSSTRSFDPPHIIIGTEYENPTTLTRQDWRGAKGWRDTDVGYWKTEAAEKGIYKIQLRFSSPVKYDSTVKLQINDVILTGLIEAGQDRITFENVSITKGYTQINGWAETSGDVFGVKYIDITKK